MAHSTGDLFHVWSEDIRLSASGDLLLVHHTEGSRQRVLRRLLTNHGDLLFHLDYGAGLPSRIGETASAANVEAIVRRQMFSEPAVSQDPPPDVRANPILGGVTVWISYVDSEHGNPASIGFTVER